MGVVASMPKVCFYFLLHQPYRLTNFSVLDLDDPKHQYFCDACYDQNHQVFDKVADKSYRPMLSLLLRLIETYPDFKFSFSCSGVFLEQAQAWGSDVLDLLKRLAAHHSQVEVVGENYYHSLAALYSPTEFKNQVKMHQKLMHDLFGIKPVTFRNTEMIYNNNIGYQVAELGFRGLLTEGVDWLLGDRPKTTLYRANCDPPLPLMLKHATLSDDIAFRFSQKSWVSWPLTSEKYLRWLHDYRDEELINLFMDFETFGEHQWSSTGIFDFFRRFVIDSVADDHLQFTRPQDEFNPKNITDQNQWTKWVKSLPIYNVDEPISWADEKRDLSAWRSNDLQIDTLKKIYDLEKAILAKKDPQLLQDWRRLQTSDHFYYMCTKYFADGDVHAYFSAYDSPYEAYRRFCIVLSDLQERCR